MTLTIRDAAQQYLDEKLQLGKISTTTHAVQIRTLAVLLRRLDGSRDVADVTRAEARRLLGVLVQEGHRPTYIDSVIGMASALFGWAEREAEVREGNPFARLGLPKRERACERRLPFTDDDLRAVWPWVQGARDPGRRWIPQLMLHLGLRPEEAGQLHTRDLGADAVWIRAGEGQRLKNHASERKLPLLEWARPFSLWAAQRRGFLFGPEIGPRGDRGRCTRVSNWFSDTLRHCLVDRGRKSLYSLRHSVATRLAEAEVPHERIGDLLGHERATMAGKVYISVCPARQHVETLRKLRLPEEIA